MKKEPIQQRYVGNDDCFNPCSNGMKKELNDGRVFKSECDVLILVLMEWRKNIIFILSICLLMGFNPCSNGMKKEHVYTSLVRKEARFNPCSNGMKKELSAIASTLHDALF